MFAHKKSKNYVRDTEVELTKLQQTTLFTL